MAEDTSKGAWWHGPLIGVAMTTVAGISNYVGSHWGGANVEQLAETEKRLTAKLSDVQHDIARVADDQKKYTDEQIRAAEKRAAEILVPKKRKARSEQ